MLEHARRQGRVRPFRAALGLALAAVLAATLSGCGLLGGSDDSGSSGGSGGLEKTKIKVAILPAADLGTLWLAQDGGFFKNEGLDVETVVAASGDAALQKMLNGEVDVAWSSYPPFFISKAAGAKDVKLIADGTAVSTKADAIVTVPNSPVKTIADLAGKRIGIRAPKTAADILTRSVMRDHGIDLNGVNWVKLGLQDVSNALKSGQVDAAFMPEPQLTQAEKTIGAIPIADINTGATQNFPLSGYGALTQWTQDNPKTMAAFQRAMLKATRAAEDRSKVEPLVVKYAKIDADTASLMTMPDFVSTLDPRRIQRVPDLLQQMGIIQTKIDVAPMIASQVNG